MFMLIFMCEVLNLYGYVIPETFNLLIKDSEDYKVDMVINEEDYEMIGRKQLEKFRLDKIQFAELDKLASMYYNNMTSDTITIDEDLYSGETETSTIPMIVVTIKNKVKATYMGHFTNHANKKREIVDENEMEYEYNYNDFIHEYYEQTNNETVDQTSEIEEYGVMNSFKRIFLSQKGRYNCNKSIGLQAVQCLLQDYKSHQHPTKEIVSRLWRIAQIWFLVYLIIAMPLWCTRGWCCCCLFCQFFKPRQTIDEAKKYLVLNPPGILKTKNGEVRYYPTERERETYEEFEHFIKTL